MQNNFKIHSHEFSQHPFDAANPSPARLPGSLTINCKVSVISYHGAMETALSAAFECIVRTALERGNVRGHVEVRNNGAPRSLRPQVEGNIAGVTRHVLENFRRALFAGHDAEWQHFLYLLVVEGICKNHEDSATLPPPRFVGWERERQWIRRLLGLVPAIGRHQKEWDRRYAACMLRMHLRRKICNVLHAMLQEYGGTPPRDSDRDSYSSM